LGGASFLAISAAVIAVQTSPAMAACNFASSNNVTGTCGGVTPSNGNFSNSGFISGAIDGDSYGVIAGNILIPTFTNSGTISVVTATGTGVRIKSSSIGSLTNSGSIGAVASNSAAYGFYIYTSSSIGSLSNIGTISASVTTSAAAYGIYHESSWIGSLSNSGTILATASSGASAYGISNAGSIGGLTNSGSIKADASYAYGISSSGSIGSLSNSGSISATASSAGSAYGISNAGSISSLTNSGSGIISVSATSSANAYGMNNVGSTGSLSNSGSISASATSAGMAYGISNAGSISSLTNSGSGRISVSAITSANAYGINSSGSIGSLSNSGSISATGSGSSANAYGINSSGSIGSLSNSGSISASASSAGNAYGIFSYGSIGSLSNSGLIGAYASSSAAQGINSSGSIGNLTNSGTISASASSIAYGIRNAGSIGSLSNIGTISASAGSSGFGIRNSGSISNLTNLGVITGGADGKGVNNSNGTIGTLINAQGGNGSLPAQTALTYSSNLPGTYLEYVTSSTHYGQLLVTGGAGTIGSFGIAEGSTLANGTYASVLSGVGTVGTTTGENGSIMGSVSVGGGFANWTLLNIGSDVWDLIISGLVSGVDAVNTLIELGFTRDEILEALRGRAAAMNNALNYDCMTFNDNGVCISFNARYTSLNDMNEGAGVMKAALRLSPTTHVGAFIDYAGKPDTQGVLAYEDGMPMFGGFLGYRQEPNGTGLKAHIAAARHTDDVTITRSATLENTEAGSGSSSLTNWAIGAELGYGLALSNQSNLTPYIGLRYGTAEMDGYAEGSSETVEYPLTLNAFSQNLTTATAGLRLDGMLGDQLTYEIAGGLEYDLKSDANAFSGSSTIPDLTTFSLENTADSNRLRGSGSFALGYAITPNQKLTTSVSVRGEAYSDQTNTNVMAGYQIQF
jgi:hypothetical protein